MSNLQSKVYEQIGALLVGNVEKGDALQRANAEIARLNTELAKYLPPAKKTRSRGKPVPPVAPSEEANP